jgi:glutamate carboxypeptidase
MFNKARFLEELSSLINIDCGTYNPAGTTKIANTLQKRFENLGFFTQIINVGNKVGPLLVAYNKKDAPHYDALLIGHMDTVYDEGLVATHQMRVEGNKIFGLGSIDMKSGILQGIYAIESLGKEVLEKLSLCFVCNPDEEISSIYSADEISKFAKKAKCALVLESAGADGIFINKRKGIARFNAKFHGKSAHASTPKEGISAVKELANFILCLEEFNNDAKETTFNVAPISGGGATNVIPDYAEMGFEVRFFDVKHYEEMKKKIDFFSNNPKQDGAKIIIEQVSFKPGLVNNEQTNWIEELTLNAAKKVGLNFKLESSGGGSDGNEISYLGVPTIDGIGPVGEYWHNADLEALFIDSVPSRIELTKQILLDLLER